MTYHSSNPFDNADYSNFAFKKSELLAILQAIDENFSFENLLPKQCVQEESFHINIQNSSDIESYWDDPIEPDYEAWAEIDKYLLEEYDLVLKQTSNQTVWSNNQDFEDYKTLLFKKPLLSKFESASIISGVSPYLVSSCNNDYEAGIEYPSWRSALDYLESCISAKLLTVHHNNINCIKRDDLKNFLLSNDIIINGFNDNTSTQYTGYRQYSTLNVDSNIENLNTEITHLKDLINEKDLEIERLNEQVLSERAKSPQYFPDEKMMEGKIIELQDQIKHLESSQQTTSLLNAIFDETMSDRYAPDLALSIRLWEDLYINNRRSDSHSNKANNWIKTNTGYSGTDKDPSTSRIREIASPFKEWGAKRDKNHKK